MSDNQEKSDDLIAELAKLMASSAGPSADGPKPTVIKLPPLNEATIKATPVRIPGMDAPKAAEAPRPAAPVSVAPAVRIPGMDRPAGVTDPGPAAAPPPRPAAQFDFGKPPAAAPVVTTTPLSTWQQHEVPKNLAPTPQPMKFEPVKFSGPDTPPPPVARFETKTPVVNPPPTPAAEPAAGQGASRPTGEGFDFDFGFGGNADARKDADKDDEASDPIADLIVAEMDAAEAAPEHPVEQPKPVVSAPPPNAAAFTLRATTTGPQRSQPAAVPVRPAGMGGPRPGEGDRFAVAPVFGLGNKGVPNPPAPPPGSPPQSIAPRGDLDPMDEIENLIGEAVRVELSGPEKSERPIERPQSRATPVVPPLNTGFAPRRAGLKDNEPPMGSPEDAILAAAAASGAEVGQLDGDDRPYKRMKVKPPKTSMASGGARQYVGMAVAATLLLAAGFGLYWVFGMNRDNPATAPVLTADITPAKVEPVVAPPTAEAQSGSVVFDEINGVADSTGSNETLVSRDETAGASVSDVASVTPPPADGGGASASDATESGLANRKVRTVTVRPDGTIVSGDDAVAGTEALPVDRPNVPAIPGGEMAPSDLLTAAVADTQTPAAPAAADPISALVAETGPATAAPVTADVPLDTVAPTPAGAQTTPPVFDASIVSPIPMPRPGDRSSMVGSGTRVAEIAPTASDIAPAASVTAREPASLPLVGLEPDPPQPQQQAATQPAVSNRGGAYVQLSSNPTQGEASQSLRALQNRMAGTLNGAALEVREVDLGARGVWYRVVLPTNSFQSATQTCAAIKSNGGDCVAING